MKQTQQHHFIGRGHSLANAINTSIPCVPLYKNIFDTTLASVKNVLILWDGGSTKKEIERSKKIHL